MPVSRALLWALLAVPGAVVAWRYAAGAMSYGEVIHATGELSVQLLLVVLAVSVLRRIFPRSGWSLWLLRERRGLGVACFGYAAFHLAVYLWRKADFGLIVREASEAGLLTGWFAFVLLLALAATSNDAAVAWLKRGWGRLHKLVYPAAALILAHWVLTAFDPTTALVYTGAFAAVVGLRLALARRKRPRSAPA